jgi:diguanylate cyclase (GGDEF)-like protein
MELWNGNLFHHREAINYALDGSERHILLHFSVFPGHERGWSRVQVALADITARKKAEAYLEYLGEHDGLTKLYNRAFYADNMNRLERKPLRPVCAIVMDLNGLKEANDQLGHDAGDGLLCRFGEILNGAVSVPNYACRIGGDEFAMLLPGADAKAASRMLETITELLKINNQFYSALRSACPAALQLANPARRWKPLYSVPTRRCMRINGRITPLRTDPEAVHWRARDNCGRENAPRMTDRDRPRWRRLEDPVACNTARIDRP